MTRDVQEELLRLREWLRRSRVGDLAGLEIGEARLRVTLTGSPGQADELMCLYESAGRIFDGIERQL